MSKRKPVHHKKVRFGTKEGKKVNMATLAEIMGVTPKTINQWVNQGMPQEGMDGRSRKFDTAECLVWRVQKEADDIRASIEGVIPEHMEYKEAQRRKEAANAQLAELELAEKRGQVAQILDIMTNVCEALSGVRAKLVSMSSRLAGPLTYQEEKEVRKIIDAEVREVLEGLSEYEHEYIGNES